MLKSCEQAAVMMLYLISYFAVQTGLTSPLGSPVKRVKVQPASCALLGVFLRMNGIKLRTTVA